MKVHRSACQVLDRNMPVFSQNDYALKVRVLLSEKYI